MSRRTPSPHASQMGLFAPDEPAFVEPLHVRPAQPLLEDPGLPPEVRLGVSTWSFPGWAGFVWKKEHSTSRLARHGLAALAKHPLFGCVGIDRTYYAPLTPSEYRDYADVVPDRFRFVVKAHEELTWARFPDRDRYGAKRGRVNGRFLDAGYAAQEVVGPMLEGLGARTGPIVFQLPPQDLPPPLAFAEQLYHFLDALPPLPPAPEGGAGAVYAVEVRNPEVLTSQYALALADTGAVPCLDVYPTMPPLPEQWAETLGVAAAPEAALVVRWMLRPGLTYQGAGARMKPFDHLVDEDPENRATLARLALEAVGRGWPVYVTVNNKAEGSAPLSVAALAREIAEAGDAARERRS